MHIATRAIARAARAARFEPACLRLQRAYLFSMPGVTNWITLGIARRELLPNASSPRHWRRKMHHSNSFRFRESMARCRRARDCGRRVGP